MPAPSDPVKVSISFGLVWAFLVAFTVSNIGKNAGLASPNLFVSLLAGLLAGAGIGTGTYFLFDRVDHPFPVDGGGAPQGLGPDWYDQINKDYIQNQTANTEYQTTQLQQQIANQLNQTQTQTAATKTQTQTDATKTQTQTDATKTQTQTDATKTQTQTDATKTQTDAAPWTPTVANCSAPGLVGDKALQCILMGYLNGSSTGTLTPYQLQQLSNETGIPVATLQTTLANITQAQAQADYQALQSPKYKLPPLSCPSGTFYSAAPSGTTGFTTPGCYITSSDGKVVTPVSSTSTAAAAAVTSAAKSGLSTRVKAAIALPIVFAALIGIMYGIHKALPVVDIAQGTGLPGFISKSLFIILLATFVSTFITAIPLGVFASKQGASKEITQAAIGIGGVAGVSLLGLAFFGLHYGKTLFEANPAIDALKGLAAATSEGLQNAKLGIAFGICMFIVGGVLQGLARKSAPAKADKMKKASYVFLSLGSVIAFVGLAIFIRSRPGITSFSLGVPQPSVEDAEAAVRQAQTEYNGAESERKAADEAAQQTTASPADKQRAAEALLKENKAKKALSIAKEAVTKAKILSLSKKELDERLTETQKLIKEKNAEISRNYLPREIQGTTQGNRETRTILKKKEEAQAARLARTPEKTKEAEDLEFFVTELERLIRERQLLMDFATQTANNITKRKSYKWYERFVGTKPAPVATPPEPEPGV
jgi:hypothetical protein